MPQKVRSSVMLIKLIAIDTQKIWADSDIPCRYEVADKFLRSDSDILFPTSKRGRLGLQNEPALSLLGLWEIAQRHTDVLCPQVLPPFIRACDNCTKCHQGQKSNNYMQLK